VSIVEYKEFAEQTDPLS